MSTQLSIGQRRNAGMLERARGRWERRRRVWQLYLLMLLPFAYLMIFRYYPMLGAQIAFKNYRVTDGIWGSPWVGLAHFERFLASYQFIRVLTNTFFLSFYQLLAGIPLPIMLALSLTYLKNKKYKRTVQTVTYAPHFISTVVLVGMLVQFLALRNGILNNVLEALGGTRQNFLAEPGAFRDIFVWSGVWQSLGYSSIIYIAALSAVAPELHEAAIVDGATILQRIRHIDFPAILPTAVILLILNAGRILEIGFEKAYLLQNPLNLRAAEIIQTYVYKIGLLSPIPQFSYAAAIGLFRGIVGLSLMLTVNWVSRRLTQSSLW